MIAEIIDKKSNMIYNNYQTTIGIAIRIGYWIKMEKVDENGNNQTGTP